MSEHRLLDSADVLPPMKPGDFAVVSRPHRYIVVPVEKVTPKQFMAPGEWSSRSHTYFRSAAVFCGAEATARKLCEQLTSSDALCDQDVRRASGRRAKRNAEYIAIANGASKGPQPGVDGNYGYAHDPADQSRDDPASDRENSQ